MHVEIAEREDPHQGIDADNGVAVVVYVAFVNPVPVVHLVIILVKIRSIVLYAEDHFKKIHRFRPQRIVHHFAVVEILENISGGPVAVVVGVNEIHKYSRQYFQNKYDGHGPDGESFNTEELDLVYQKDKQQRI